MKDLFKHSVENPFHISVGVLLINSEGRILVHHYQRSKMPERYLMWFEQLDDLYILMRESLENNESLEQAIHRGLSEEFGARGEIKRYIGSIQAIFPNAQQQPVEKTTLYFQVLLSESGSHERHLDGVESLSDLEWCEPQELLSKLKIQRDSLKRTDMDETKIVESYLRLAQ